MNICDLCGTNYYKVKSWQKYCSSYCKNKANRTPYDPDYAKVYAQTPVFKYNVQKQGAKRRGIQFLITFEEWWAFWQPHWEQRGKEKEALVMCRFNDEGPYAIDNVYLDTYSNNSKLGASLQEQDRDVKSGRFV